MQDRQSCYGDNCLYKGFLYDGEKYSFSYMWGGGGPLSPDGESDEGTISFSMELEKGEKQAVISLGKW